MSSITPPVDLLSLVSNFLSTNGYEKAAKQVQKQAKDQGITLPTDAALPALNDVFQAYQAQNSTVAEKTEDASSESDSSDSSDSDSDSDSSSSESEAEQPSKKRKAASPAAADDSSDASEAGDDSDDSSDDEVEEAAPPAKKSKKARAASPAEKSSSSSSSDDDSSDASSESDSSESEDNDSDDDSSSSSSSDSDSESSSDSSSSSSDSDDSSESESEEEVKPKASKKEKKDKKPKAVEAVVKVEVKPVRETSTSSSATLEGDETQQDTLLIPAQAPVEEEHMHPDRKRKLPDSFNAAPAMTAVPATEENVKRLKKENIPFSRIPKDQYVDPRFASNAYQSYDYAEKAHQALIVTKGKDFTKAKNKGKRGSYRGGKIDMGFKGIKFED